MFFTNLITLKSFMNIVIAPDKFKGSLSAIEVCNALTKGLKTNNPNLQVISCPMADGGDGSLDTMNHYFNLKPVELIVNDPLFSPIKSTYYISKKTAYIEMSSASGLVLLKKEDRNCMNTSSFGTGELILDAVQNGATTINLFIGGSATNDGGIGMASALGYKFYDSSENLLSPLGKNLLLINRIDNTEVHFDPQMINIKVICDVNNPLHGKNGAAYIYAAQKGASLIEIEQLNKGLVNLASKLIVNGFPDIADIPGSGAAGGAGGGAVAFFGAKLISGIQNFIEITKLEALIKDCDLVITGEGKIDSQTERGKVVSGVCNIAKHYVKPVIAVCGGLEKGVSNKLGLKKVYSLLDRTNSIEKAMENGKEYLVEIGKDILLNLRLNKSLSED